MSEGEMLKLRIAELERERDAAFAAKVNAEADAELYRRGYDSMGAADISEYLALCASAKRVYDISARVAELERERDALQKQLREEELAHENTIRHRDFCERWADKLASGVGDVEVIGEHSNLNNPWETAYGLMRSLAEFQALEAENVALRGVYRRAVDTYPQPTPMTAELSAWWGAVYRSFLLASGEKT